MDGLMMDHPLTLSAILRRGEALFGGSQIVTRLPDRSVRRYSFSEMAGRARRLAVALGQLGIAPGERVATLGWNHHQHLEAYFGIPAAGAVLHTLNLRLHPDELAYIVGHADDKAILVDAALLPLLDRFRDRLRGVQVIVVSDDESAVPPKTLSYETLLTTAAERGFEEPHLHEDDAAAMCYTTGTTGRPKGVLYSHRALALHSLALCLVDSFGLCEADTVLPVVPMFHANAWGLPFACVMVGSTLVLPGPHLDPPSLAELYQAEQVTVTAGVPTIWMGLLQLLDASPGVYDLSSLRALVVGGSAAPVSMIRGFDERHGLRVIQAWGMTETSPLGTVSTLPRALETASLDDQYAQRAKQGRPAPFIEVRAHGKDGPIPWDGASMGELEVRGPWVAGSYYNEQEQADRFTSDGWFRTGDVVTIDARGAIEIQDRLKDLIKSGGEWISSVALENALMGHPAIAEAAVVAIPHPRWQERPLAAARLKPGHEVSTDELRAFLVPQFPSWWLPDEIIFVEAIPRSSAGKFLKSALRERFKDHGSSTNG